METTTTTDLVTKWANVLKKIEYRADCGLLLDDEKRELISSQLEKIQSHFNTEIHTSTDEKETEHLLCQKRHALDVYVLECIVALLQSKLEPTA